MKQYFYHSKSSPRCTVAMVVEGELAKFGAARCSRNDQFTKKIGRQISLGRALKNAFSQDNLPDNGITEWFVSKAEAIIHQISKNPQLLEKK